MARIIVGYDGSSNAMAALTWAAREARLRRLPLQVISVDNAPDADGDGEREAALRARLGPDVERIASGIHVEHYVEPGEPAHVLVERCDPGDILVFGSRGRSPLAERLLGSTSYTCMHTAPCTAVVVREHPAAREDRVVVGVDGSAESQRAIVVAAEEAHLRHVGLTAVHAVHWDSLGTEWITPTDADLIGWGHQLVDKEIAEAGVEADRLVTPGRPAEVLAKESESADLLVVGTRGHGSLAGLLLGATADHLVRHSHCPVMVVRQA